MIGEQQILNAEQQTERLEKCAQEIMDVLTKYDVHAIVYLGHIQDGLPNNRFNLQSEAISTLKPTTYGQLNALIEKAREHVDRVIGGLQQAIAEAERREASPN